MVRTFLGRRRLAQQVVKYGAQGKLKGPTEVTPALM